MSNIHGFNNEQRWTVFFYELLGTSIFLYCTIMLRDPAAITFTLFAITVLFGRVSGGHFNPAITTSVFLSQSNFADNFYTYLVMIGA